MLILELALVLPITNIVGLYADFLTVIIKPENNPVVYEFTISRGFHLAG